MKEEPDRVYPSNIEGLEDVRLFYFKNKIHFSASSKNLTNDGKIVIAIGEYNINDNKMNNISVINPPRPSNCEKNWIFVPNNNDKMNFIYGWHPLEIGAVNDNNQLIIHTKIDTPKFFSRFRGSSPIIEYNDKLWCVVHYVKYSTPRVYYHSVVCFNKETMTPEMYSLPFCFMKKAIEYCLGFYIKDGKMCFIFSQNDTEPGFITLPLNNLVFLQVK
jgi:hypothetical protein